MPRMLEEYAENNVATTRLSFPECTASEAPSPPHGTRQRDPVARRDQADSSETGSGTGCRPLQGATGGLAERNGGQAFSPAIRTLPPRSIQYICLYSISWALIVQIARHHPGLRSPNSWPRRARVRVSFRAPPGA